MLRRNRSRGSTPRRNNNNGHSNNGRSHHGGAVYERPEARPRYGVASQNYERYMNQAKDALSSGDRVQAEFFYQHADHYLRILNEYKEQQRVQQAQHQEAQVERENTGDVAADQAPDQPALKVVASEKTSEQETVKVPPRRQTRKPRAKTEVTPSSGGASAE